MIEFIAFLAEFFSADHLVIGTNVALALVTFKAIPRDERRIALHIRVVRARKVARKTEAERALDAEVAQAMGFAG